MTSIREALESEATRGNGGNTSAPCVLCTAIERSTLEAARLVRGMSYGAIARAMIQAEIPGVERYPNVAALKAAVGRHFNHRENA